MMAAATILERLIIVARDRRRQLPRRAQITTPRLSALGVADESRSTFPHLVRRVTFAVGLVSVSISFLLE
jgi:hypothetical protein